MKQNETKQWRKKLSVNPSTAIYPFTRGYPSWPSRQPGALYQPICIRQGHYYTCCAKMCVVSIY